MGQILILFRHSIQLISEMQQCRVVQCSMFTGDKISQPEVYFHFSASQEFFKVAFCPGNDGVHMHPVRGIQSVGLWDILSYRLLQVIGARCTSSSGLVDIIYD
jgi:hypothetical protein